MNVTISIDDRLLRRARDVARRRGQSLNALVRGYLETLAGERSGAAIAADLLELMNESPGRSGGKKLRREDAYQGRL